MRFTRFLAASFALWARVCSAAPSVSVVSNTQLDAKGVFFVSFDGIYPIVNVNSFQLSGVLAYQNFQYAAWYTSTRMAVLGRRTLPSGAWSTLQLPHNLSTNDSHNVIALGVSPADGKIHVALDCHSTQMFYTVSEANLATSGNSWVASRFSSITNTLGTLNIGTTVTYPQFVVTPNNNLQFVYRSGVSGNGATQLAEYSAGTWKNVGSWASATGTYTSPNGATSTLRNLYIHGFTYHGNRAYVTGTWREQNGAVSCSSAGLTNHDTVYFYSDDMGRTWFNSAGTKIATSGSSPVNVNTAGIIVDALSADHGLMNQESQAVDSTGLIHAIISYVPGRFTQCVSNYETDRPAFARPFHVYRSTNGTFTKVEIPFAIQSVGRSQIVIDSKDNIYVIMPFVRIATASKASGWTDWTIAYNGTSAGLNAFGEITLDRARISSGLVRQLRSLIGLQVLSRGVTFLLNRALLGIASPGAYGTAAIQFELISSTILFLSREGVRNALLRVKPAQDGSWSSGNLSFLPIVMGIPLALATTVGYAQFAAQETKMQPGFYNALGLYSLAAVLELCCEPMHNQAMAESKTHIRVSAEGMGVTLKTCVTYAVLLYDSAAKLDGRLALLAFALGQLSYSLVLLLVYLSHYGISVLFPKSAQKGTVESGIFRLSLTMTSQSVIKHFLTEGDKLVLGWFSPLKDQGGYALAVNYGSLIARIVFQPIEETSRIRFSKMLASPSSTEVFETASSALTALLSIQTSLSLILLVFGTAYLPIVLPVLLPRQYLATSAPHVLSAWVWYIPVLALNGGVEAFISSVSSPGDLNLQSWWMGAFSVVYIGAAIQLYGLQFGDTSLVFANIINLSARIAFAVYFISAYFTRNNAHSHLRWRTTLPGWRHCLVSVGAGILVRLSERRLDISRTVARAGSGISVLRNKNVLMHIAVGGVLGIACLATWWFTEGRKHISRTQKRAKTE
ncbi:Rft protein-domain-containing protein [Favolaschia claudopus]|uniref:Man(5)GlcNAc(2)-PP-dolichol translocation protein RFT1 n=1 Tax=Favolaschia claudopus TaxID=2862362 RepID=A0AAW0CA02_9AGAR